MVSILFSSMFLYECTVDKISEAIEKAGYDGIEFWVETPHFWIDKDENKLKSIKNFKNAVHSAVLDLNPASINRKVREVTITEGLFSIYIAKKIKADLMTFHAGKRSAAREPVDEDYQSLHDYVRVMKKYAEIKGVRISIENSENGINNLCRTPEEIFEFVEYYDISFTFDVNHALKNKNADRFIELLSDRIENVHVSSFDEKGRHVSARKDKRVAMILEELVEFGYDKIITVELDDLGYRRLYFQDKVEELRREKEFLEKFFRT
ncbi:sugar phosphate isomerase/epimerase [Archaeoglobales archaeon]|nr:MAG: sugar phosphate isomerase/epimerase [Archaeoglobales archaeon]